MLTRLFAGHVELSAVVLAVAGTIGAAWIAARLVRRVMAAWLRGLMGDPALLVSSPTVRAPLRIIGGATFVFVLAILLFPAFELAGLRPRAGVPLRNLADWSFGAGLRTVLIIVLAYALVRTTALLVRRFEHDLSLGTDLDALERAKRARTLGAVVHKAATVLVIGSAALMVLQGVGIDITPVLTGAGIAGLAVGFGAQTLVRDIISGFFLILENQVRVGDVAAINGTGGVVESINLRTVILRDVEGTVHVFPNGAINTLANRSKDFSYYVIDLSVSYFDDTDAVAAVLKDVGAHLQSDSEFGPAILAPLEVLGVESFGDWSIQIKARIKTMPSKQWFVGRELRRRIIKAFEQHGFSIPFPVPSSTVPKEPRRLDAPPPDIAVRPDRAGQ
ncbi:MAG: moderate conductance mechanosensitive channel [Acidobacteriota bacterium]